jgi:Hypothetical protein (DUF2513)
MTFDPTLMRSILLDTEGLPAGVAAGGFNYDGIDQAVVNRHTQILIDEGYLEGIWQGDAQNFPCAFRITDLTYRGHQFLANAKSDSLWKKALTTIKDSGKSLSIAVIEAVLVKLATAAE